MKLKVQQDGEEWRVIDEDLPEDDRIRDCFRNAEDANACVAEISLFAEIEAALQDYGPVVGHNPDHTSEVIASILHYMLDEQQSEPARIRDILCSVTVFLDNMGSPLSELYEDATRPLDWFAAKIGGRSKDRLNVVK